MEYDTANDIIVTVLAGIAPEIDPSSVDRSGSLQFEFDLDSIDFLNLIEGVGNATGATIPERDYASISTLDDFTAYIAHHVD